VLNKKSYFDKYLVKDKWGSGKKSFNVFFYTRSLSDLLKPFLHSDFKILSIDEPLPKAECKRLSPKVFKSLSKQPAFLFMVLQK